MRWQAPSTWLLAATVACLRRTCHCASGILVDLCGLEESPDMRPSEHLTAGDLPGWAAPHLNQVDILKQPQLARSGSRRNVNFGPSYGERQEVKLAWT